MGEAGTEGDKRVSERCDMIKAGMPTHELCGATALYEATGRCTKCTAEWDAFVCREHAAEIRMCLTGCNNCRKVTVELVNIRTLAAS
jgi:hypothetical protein